MFCSTGFRFSIPSTRLLPMAVKSVSLIKAVSPVLFVWSSNSATLPRLPVASLVDAMLGRRRCLPFDPLLDRIEIGGLSTQASECVLQRWMLVS